MRIICTHKCISKSFRESKITLSKKDPKEFKFHSTNPKKDTRFKIQECFLRTQRSQATQTYYAHEHEFDRFSRNI